MVCTELFGMITVAFEFTRYQNIDLNSSVFSINKTHYLNKQVGVVRWVWLQWQRQYNSATYP